MIARRTVSLIAAAAMAAGTLLVLSPSRSVHADSATFDTAQMLPAAPNLGLPHNEDGEPGIAQDGGGTIWIASDVAPYAADDPRAQTTGVLSGSDVWKSTDHGKTFQWVADPFQQSVTNAVALGGEDTDIAANPVQNSNGCYDIWVASLWVGSTSLAVSQDCGVTWNVVPVNGIPAQDRPWLAASGACTVLFSYHAIAPYDTVVDEFSLPPCTGQGMGSAVSPTETLLFAGNIAPGLSNRFGKLVVDNSPSSPYQGHIYQPMQGCTAATPGSNTQVPEGCTTAAEIFMGVGTVSGNAITWTDPVVHTTNSTTVYIWPATAAVDTAGNVYIAWMEGPSGYAQNLFISVSHDGGAIWTSPVQINQPPSLSGAYATVAALSPGTVEAAWYGTDRNGGTDDPSVMGIPATTANPACGGTSQPACWRLWWGVSNDYGGSWSEQPVTGTIHTGTLCTEGGGCGANPGDRNLLDDFGMLIDPQTGGAVITFTNDQPESVAGKTHTDFIAQVVPPAGNTPEFGAGGPALALLGAGGLAAAGLRRRRSAANRGRGLG